MLGRRAHFLAPAGIALALLVAGCLERPAPTRCETWCPADRSSHDYRLLETRYGLHPIGDQEYFPVNPQLDGDLVAFHHTVTGDQPLIRKTEIWVYNIAKNTLRTVADEEGVRNLLPLVSDGRVVWTRNAGPDEWEIRMYDDATNTTTTVPIPVAGGPQGQALRGSKLVYSVAKNLGPEYGTRIFDLETHEDSLLYRIDPDESVHHLVLTDNAIILGKNRETEEGRTAEISRVSIATKEETVLASQPGYTVRRVAADNGYVAWESSTTGRPTIWTLDDGIVKQVDRMDGFGGTEPNIVGHTVYYTEGGNKGGVSAYDLEAGTLRALIPGGRYVTVSMQHDEDGRRGVADASVYDPELDAPSGQRLYWFEIR